MAGILSAFNSQSNLSVSQFQMLDEPAGTFARTLPRSRVTVVSSAALATSAQAYIRGIIIPAGATLHSLTVQVNAVAVGGTHDWIGLTDVNGNVLAMSADGGGALFSPAVTRIVIPMSASTVFPVSQFCYVVACSVFATTAPGIDGDNALGAGVAIGGAPAGTPVLAGTIGAATQSTPPAISSNLGAIASVAGSNFYAAAA